MKKVWIIAVLLIAIAECAFYKGMPAPQTPEKKIKDQLITQIDSFSVLISQQLLPEAQNSNPDLPKLRQLFLQSRLAYKKFEWAAEYFNAITTRIVNGPPVPESGLSGFVQQPGGLQVIEGYLYPKYDPADRRGIVRELKSLLFSCNNYRNYYQHVTISNAQIWDAAKLEVFRVITLNIAGFDAPQAKSGVRESACSLRSLNQVLSLYKTTNVVDNLSLNFSKAISYLEAGTSFDSFNRAVFITAYVNPLTIVLTQAQQALDIPEIQARRLYHQNALTLFDEKAFDASAYAAYEDDKPTVDKIALGRKLFNEPLLSGSGTRSCATCHQPEEAFTDGLVKNKALDGHDLLLRNTPTLLNAAFQPAQFADMRETTLEDQSKNVIENKREMNGSLKQASKILSNSSAYSKLFVKAYPQSEKMGIGRKEITGAIAAYVRTLSVLNSSFDEYMRGKTEALNTEEVKGFNLFMGKARCGTCHYMPLFNGALPPLYNRTDAEVLGVPATITNTQIDADPGRNAITHAITDDHAFKIPTVRNAALTAPYMHNGVFNTLEEVIDFYDKGGGTGAGLKVANQTLPREPLQLTAKEKQELIAFIKALNNKP